MSKRRIVAAVLLVAALSAPALACAGDGSPSENATLHLLEGSELKDMQPILDAAEKATGVRIDPTYLGSLEGADRVASGAAGIDGAWFASDKYVALAGAGAKVLSRVKIARSPVVLGVRTSVAKSLGWDKGNVTWQQIADAAKAGTFRFAMTNPTASNSGFSALVSVADALAGGQALANDTIDRDGLKGFLLGQKLSAGSSGFLVDSFLAEQDRLDGIVNYESVLVNLNANPQLTEPLVLVYPTDGVVTADYPMMLVNADKRAAYDKVTAYLTRPEVQAEIQKVTARRAAVAGVPADGRLNSGLLVEASFPGSIDVARDLLAAYSNELRRPARTIYVLDTSGSMDGARLDSLKTALSGLTGIDTTLTGQFTQFASREQVTMINFSNVVGTPQMFTIDSTDANSPTMQAVRAYSDSLQAGGGTAIFSALDSAYALAKEAAAADPTAYVSVVLMTDGENNSGLSSDELLARLQQRPDSERDIRVFTVLFGDANPQELSDISAATGGKVFDARTAPLDAVFKEIRGYQ